VDLIERLAGLADAMHVPKMTKPRRRQPIGIEVGASVRTRVVDLAERLADDARVRAYEVLGDRPRAVEIMECRLARLWASASSDVEV
jgi:hypothetical protein